MPKRQQLTGTLFRYEPEGWIIFGPWNNEVWSIPLIIWGNAPCVFLLCFIVPKLLLADLQKPLLVASLTIIFMIWWNTRIFANLLWQSDIELTTEKVIIHLSRHWRVSINLSKLHAVRVREFTVPETMHMGLRSPFKLCSIYLVCSPGLSWYFRFTGLPFMFVGGGFFITSWHNNYKEFLDKMRAYEAQ